MPSYDYKCKDCDKAFTITKSMNDLTVPDCPECKSENVSKVWGGFIVAGKSNSDDSSSSKCGSCSSSSCSTCGG
ncbi:MAG: zinc ribbon domain-containing protein [bacterium]